MYLAASRRDKPEIAKLLVNHWRGLTPPGRFLAKQTTTSSDGEAKKLWFEIGDEAAKKRASKSLGEKQKAALTPKELYMSSPSSTGKANPKTRLRSLEARAARSEGCGSPRCDRADVSFPVAQNHAEAAAQSFLYQPIPLDAGRASGNLGVGTGMPPLNAGSVNQGSSASFSMLNKDALAMINSYGMQSIPSNGLASNCPPNALLGLDLMAPSSNYGQSSSMFRFNQKHDYQNTVSPDQSVINFNQFSAESSDHDVPTAAELTACWDE